jgi:hypothetical protein
MHVNRLYKVWEKRFGGVDLTLEESRIGRITGTTAKIVMRGKNKPTAGQLSQIFGCSTFHATLKMQIGTLLEPKILQAYLSKNRRRLKNERGSSKLALLYQHNYVGHTPDGKTPKGKTMKVRFLKLKLCSTLKTIYTRYSKNTSINCN